MSTVMYGISNCDTIKKAKKFLTDANIEFTFHDYRKDGLSPTLLDTLIAELGWEALLNKRGTTFRALSDEQKNNLNETSAKAIMLAQPAIIKRPVLLHQGSYHLGFSAAQYQALV
ncbi:ArsC family reductase [Pseudoalteromonas fenneropenaei]|uniref:ArsC family reductase n=1 Tax=Pseudoalteromonas fenneropenaei TaxID=1737459 RepID=A0ABV7CF58_9GAMM